MMKHQTIIMDKGDNNLIIFDSMEPNKYQHLDIGDKININELPVGAKTHRPSSNKFYIVIDVRRTNKIEFGETKYTTTIYVNIT